MASKFTSNGTLREMIDSFDKMNNVPLKTMFQLEMALAKGFAMTQTNVHVITSSLKWSGTSDSDYDGETWTAEIAYGGPSKGIHNPVEYAMFEQQRGGEHDFMSPLEMTSDEMDIIIEDMWNDAV